MGNQFPPNLSHLQNNPPENNMEPVPAKSQITADATFPDSKKAGIENKSQWQAIIMPNGRWSIRQVKNEKKEAGEYKQWT
jgi:hypothetical protein